MGGHRLAETAAFIACATLAGLLLCGRMAAAQAADDPKGAWQMSDPVVRATNRGVALMERYEYAKAVEALEEALGLASDSVEIRVNLAIALYNRCAKGDLERAEAVLDEVLRGHPEDGRALYFRAITHQYRGDDEKAVPLFEQVVRLLPHDACAWYLLARSKSHLGQPCRMELERAVRENPALVSAYYDLMRAARQAGDNDGAQHYMEMFTKLRQSPLAEKVVMPQYNEMGPLARVRPLATVPSRNPAGGELTAGAARTIFEAPGQTARTGEQGRDLAVVPELLKKGWPVAVADVNGDHHLDMVITEPVSETSLGCVLLLIGQADGRLIDLTSKSGLAPVCGALSFAFGDYDNNGKVDLFISRRGANHLFRGRGDGTFVDVTKETGTAGLETVSTSAVFLDADHDGDLDIYVCNFAAGDNGAPAANQLLNNNADGTFTDITDKAGVTCAGQRSIMLAPADLDGDRDTDLIVFNQAAAARVFFNDRLGEYHDQPITGEPIRGDHGGVLQDFNGDGRVDLLVSPALGEAGRLFLTDGTDTLKPSAQFDGVMKAILSWGPVRMARVGDVDLDGDLDIVFFARDGHALINDGWGRFVAQARVWPGSTEESIVGTELMDRTGDGILDVLRMYPSPGQGRIDLSETKLTPPAGWLVMTPTGDRGDDKRTRSPASGFGTRIELRCGLHRQVITYTGLSGGSCQSQEPVIFGLNGATKADYVHFTWPDGVTQCENELAANTRHRIKEMERRVSSCPVLFAWNGKRFGFISDFAGVGGIGYFVAPGEYAPPQVLEHVKIEPEQLAVRDGFYELRLAEPMEEVAYVDRVELLVVDHPEDASVYPDERLSITGPPPTHRLLRPKKRIFPVKAVAPDGAECTAQLAEVDRVYAYQPRLDRRFYGFCEPHALILDFGDRLAELGPGQGVYLFLNGWIEYPYSQTTFAAAQAGVTWQPMKLEWQDANGQWKVIIPDAGAPGGMGRMITIDLTDKVPALVRRSPAATTPADGPRPATCKLRISTNLEIYFDQLFIAADGGTAGLTITSLPPADASLRRLGFPLEYSPDGRHPYIYTYDLIEPTSSFKLPKGAYTRYGPVESLLRDFDDRYVILGTGDEIAVRFDARALPPVLAGNIRSFVLISHAYCKDMDLYTAEPDTVEPLPFQGMDAYPYSPGERYPGRADLGTYHQNYNTRFVD